MESPSQKIHKVFIKSNFRDKRVEKSSDFTFYCRPALTGVSKLKVRSVSIPMSQYTFAKLDASERTFSAFTHATGYSIPATVVFDDNRLYTRSEFAAAINQEFTNVSINVVVTADAHDGTALIFTNNFSDTVMISNFPKIGLSGTLPRGILPGQTFHTGHLDFGSSISKVSYLALPNLIKSSRCGIGRQSIVTSVLNTDSTTYGNYATRIDDSAAEHILGKNEVDEIHIQVLTEDHTEAKLGELPVFVELEIY